MGVLASISVLAAPTPCSNAEAIATLQANWFFASNSAAAHEKQNCSSSLTDFHINEAWSEDISGGVLSPDDFTLPHRPVQMPGY